MLSFKNAGNAVITLTSRNKNAAGETLSVSLNVNVARKSLSFENFKLVGENIYAISVPNSSETLDFKPLVTAGSDDDWRLTSDSLGNTALLSKIAPLKIGDNTVYVVMTNKNSDEIIYTMRIRRRPMYTVSFQKRANSDGYSTTFVTSSIEEGELAQAPASSPTEANWKFISWDFDFNTPITGSVKVNSKWAINLNGSGTQADPHIIKDKTDLKLVSKVSYLSNENFSGVYFALDADIDLEGEEFEPIGIMGSGVAENFSGHFDGRGHTVSNFKITSNVRTLRAGLFTVNRGTITRLGVTDFTIEITEQYYLYAGGLAAENSGVIKDCFSLRGTIKLTGVYRYQEALYAYAGGLVGHSWSGSVIENCYAGVSVSATAYGERRYGTEAAAGGLIGGSVGAVTNSFALSDVSTRGNVENAGGLAGNIDSADNLVNCYRYSSQTVKVSFNNIDINAFGQERGTDDFNSSEFYTETLKWDPSVWDFSDLSVGDGKTPVLKHA
jgi:hypothetical protein